VQVTAYRRQTVTDRGVVRSSEPLKFWSFDHITGTAKPKVVKFCAHVGCINSSNKMTYHPQRVVVMVTWLFICTFCCLLWCSASRAFVSDSWATCFSKYGTFVSFQLGLQLDQYAGILYRICMSQILSDRPLYLSKTRLWEKKLT